MSSMRRFLCMFLWLTALTGCGGGGSSVDASLDGSVTPDSSTPPGDGGTLPGHDCGAEEPTPPAPVTEETCLDPDPVVAGVTISRFDIVDPDPSAILPDPRVAPLVDDGPVSFEVEVSVPSLTAGTTTDVPMAVYLTPTDLTPAEMMDPDLRCPIGSVWLRDVSNTPTVRRLENVIIPDGCFAMGSAFVAKLYADHPPGDPLESIYFASFALGAIPCDSANASMVPIHYFNHNQSDGTVAEPDCISGNVDVGSGCAWEVTVSLNHALDFRVASETLGTSSCVAPVDDGSSGVPFSQVTMSILGYGQHWATDRVTGTEPILVEYRMWPSRLDETAAVPLLAGISEDPAGASDNVDLGGVLVGTIDARDHTLFLTDAARAQVLTGDWSGDELFRIEGCMRTASMAPRAVDCAQTEVFVDRSYSISEDPAAESLPPGAGGGSCLGWILRMADWDRDLGDSRTVLAHAGAHSSHVIGNDCLQTHNDAVAEVTALGRYRYALLDARAGGTADIVSDGAGGLTAALDGRIQVTVLNQMRIDEPLRSDVALPALLTVPDGTLCAPRFRYTVFGVVQTSVRLCALGEIGWEGGLRVETEAAPFAAPFTTHTGVTKLSGTIGPVASLGVSATASASFLAWTGSINGRATILQLGLPVTTTLRIGVDGAGAREGAFGVGADITVAYGGPGRLIASCTGRWPCERQKVLGMFDSTSETTRPLLRFPASGTASLYSL